MNPVRFTHLKLMALSGAHYRAAVEDETYAKERGTGVHSVILGGARVVAYPGPVRRGKEYEAFCAANGDAQVVTRSDYERIQGMAVAVRSNPRAMEVLEGEREVEVDWSYLGRSCQSHIDVVGGGGTFITELKTTVSSQPDRFAWQAHKMGYFAQLSFYWEALEQSGRGTPRDAYVVAVESKPPYVVTVMRVTARALELGRRAVRLWMERLLGCEAANDWPGYVQGVVDLDAPDEDVELVFGPGGGDDGGGGFDPNTGEVAA